MTRRVGKKPISMSIDWARGYNLSILVKSGTCVHWWLIEVVDEHPQQS